MTVARLHKLIYLFLTLGALSLIVGGIYVSNEKRRSARQMYSGFLGQIVMTMEGWVNESYMPPEEARARTIVEGVIKKMDDAKETLPISFDVYIVDGNRNAASTPRFYKEAEKAKGIKVDAVADQYHFNSTPINNALAGQTGEMVAPDYRGIPTLSAFAPIRLGKGKGAISVEMDEEEALGVTDKISHHLDRIFAFICFGLAGLCLAKKHRILTKDLQRAQAEAEAHSKAKAKQLMTLNADNEVLASDFDEHPHPKVILTEDEIIRRVNRQFLVDFELGEDVIGKPLNDALFGGKAWHSKHFQWFVKSDKRFFTTDIVYKENGRNMPMNLVLAKIAEVWGQPYISATLIKKGEIEGVSNERR